MHHLRDRAPTPADRGPFRSVERVEISQGALNERVGQSVREESIEIVTLRGSSHVRHNDIQLRTKRTDQRRHSIHGRGDRNVYPIGSAIRGPLSSRGRSRDFEGTKRQRNTGATIRKDRQVGTDLDGSKRGGDRSRLTVIDDDVGSLCHRS